MIELLTELTKLEWVRIKVGLPPHFIAPLLLKIRWAFIRKVLILVIAKPSNWKLEIIHNCVNAWFSYLFLFAQWRNLYVFPPSLTSYTSDWHRTFSESGIIYQEYINWSLTCAWLGMHGCYNFSPAPESGVDEVPPWHHCWELLRSSTAGSNHSSERQQTKERQNHYDELVWWLWSKYPVDWSLSPEAFSCVIMELEPENFVHIAIAWLSQSP